MPFSKKREKVVRRRLADGTVKEYRYAAKDKAAPQPRFEANAVAALVLACRRNPEFTAPSRSTAKHYGVYLRHPDKIGTLLVTDVKRRTLLAMRDALAATKGNVAANAFARICSTLFAWACDREWIDHPPASRLRSLPGGHIAAWTVADADAAEAAWPEPLRRVVILARYTGQRRGDLIAMTWRAYDGATLRVRQQKGSSRTNVPELVIPVHPTLKAELDAWRRDATSTHILTSRLGKPWTGAHLSFEVRHALPSAGLRAGLNVHGLRKLAATSLADAGCSAHEIASITGHRTLAMVSLYTASADQQRLARSAIVRLESASKKMREHGA